MLGRLLGGLLGGIRPLAPGLPAPLAHTQIRWTTYGQEYQPSTRRRKRKFGYLARLWSVGGRKVLHRRILKGRLRLAA